MTQSPQGHQLIGESVQNHNRPTFKKFKTAARPILSERVNRSCSGTSGPNGKQNRTDAERQRERPSLRSQRRIQF